ncbi:GIY-YIG nuclease family protein [Vibrio fluvialis]
MTNRYYPKEFQDHGYVYLMLDPVNPNTFKFGLSKDPIERVEQLYTTGTPDRLELYQVWSVTNMRSAERIAHKRFADHRLNDSREFFEIVTFKGALDHNLEVPHQHFGGRDLADIYLQALTELLEADWYQAGLTFEEVDINDLFQKKDFLAATRKKFDSF